jgi:hypothetical protein
MRQDTAARVITLPPDLAPSLVEQVVELLDAVTLTPAPPLVIDLTYRGPRCVVCHQGGKLGGHHGRDGRIEWIHRKCHRRLHRSENNRLRAAQLPMAC